MILSIHGIVNSGGVSYDADAQAFMTAATITDTTQKTAVNTLVTDLKAANIWTKMKALYPFVGGTAAQHRFNLKSPGTTNADFYLDFIGGGTHSSTGYIPNGTNAYADTKLIPSTEMSASDFAHLSYYSNSNTQKVGEYVMGGNDLTKSLGLISRRNTNLQFFVSTNTSATYEIASNTSASTGAGFLLGTQLASTTKLFRGNVLQASNTTASSGVGLSTKKIYIGGNNDNDNFVNYTDKICSFSSIGNGLTDTEASNLYTAVQLFNTTLSRNI